MEPFESFRKGSDNLLNEETQVCLTAELVRQPVLIAYTFGETNST